MITAADSFVDPGSQTADQIVRIYRSLEVCQTLRYIISVFKPFLFQKAVILKFQRPDESQDAGGTLLQLHQPEVLASHEVGAVDRNTDPLRSGPQATEAPRPPVGFGIYDRKGTKDLIVGCRDETYLRIRSVKQENRTLLGVGEWWNGVSAGANRPIRMAGLT